jgi:hypothetical protein
LFLATGCTSTIRSAQTNPIALSVEKPVLAAKVEVDTSQKLKGTADASCIFAASPPQRRFLPPPKLTDTQKRKL